jgi:hypothetical protein
MKQQILIILILIVLISCKKTEIIESLDNNTKLIVKWDPSVQEDSSFKKNSMVYIYDNEDDYLNPIGNPLAKHSFANIPAPDIWHSITEVNSVTFENLEPKIYWVKFFNSAVENKIVDHNQNLPFILENTLIENSVTTVTIRTERVFIRSYTIKKIEIYKIPSGFNISVGDTVYLMIYERGFPGSLIDLQKIIFTGNHILYEPKNVTISSFYPSGSDTQHFIIVSVTDDPWNGEFYEMRIFGLLYTNAYLGEEYVKKNSQNEIEYKLYVNWIFNE